MLDRLKTCKQPSSSSQEWGWSDYDAGKDEAQVKDSLKRKLSLVFKPSGKKLGGKQQQLGGWQFDALDETRPGRVMPSLPREIWIEILAMASGEGHINNYKADILSYSLVSKAWNTYSQPALYHTVHMRKSSQAKALALTLLSQICTEEGSNKGEGSGRHMRFLTIKTASYDRCDPTDILVILQNARHLIGFSDSGGIRCPLLEEYSNRRAAPEKLLELVLASGRLECLTWTAYPHLSLPLPGSSGGDFMGGFKQLRSLHLYLPPNADSDSYSEALVPLHFPRLIRLVLTLSDPILSKSSSRSTSTPANTMMALLSEWSLPALRIVIINTPFTLHHTSESPLGDGFWKFFQVHGKGIAVLEFGRLNRGTPYSVPYSKDVLEMEKRWIESQVRDVEAELLRSDTTESINSPSLSSLPLPLPSSPRDSPSLAALTPNLRTFICSASLSSSDSSWDFDFGWGGLEWDWTHPDWLAPHPLLPSHPNVRMIGVRDLGDRVRADWDKHVHEREENDDQEEDEEEGADPFFTLYEQFSSLLLPSTPTSPSLSFSSSERERQQKNIPFPSLKYIRDLDPDSDLLRRGVRHLGKVEICANASGSGNGLGLAIRGPLVEGRRTPSLRAETPIGSRFQWRRQRRGSSFSVSSLSTSSPTSRLFSTLTPSFLTPPSLTPIVRSPDTPSFGILVSSRTTTTTSGLSPPPLRNIVPGHAPLLGLWSKVLERTRGGEVWLEDWRGWNLTRSNLERWARGGL